MAHAEFILGMCERFHCLPSALEDEDATLLGLMAIAARGKPEGGDVSGE